MSRINPPPSLSPTRSIVAEHWGIPDSPAPTTQELAVVMKTKKFYTPDMQYKIAVEYDRSGNKRATLKKYDISQSAVCRWIKLGILDSGTAPAARRSGRVKIDAPTDYHGRPIENLLWDLIADARKAGKITTEEARRVLELVL